MVNPGSPGLVGYWRFDEGSGQVVGDLSTAGNDGFRGAGGDTCGDGADPTWVVGGDIVIDVVDQDCPIIEMCVFDLCGICIIPGALGMFVGLLRLKGLRGQRGLPGRRGK